MVLGGRVRVFQKGSLMKADTDKALCVALTQRSFVLYTKPENVRELFEHKATDIFSSQLLKPLTKGKHTYIHNIPPNTLIRVLSLHWYKRIQPESWQLLAVLVKSKQRSHEILLLPLPSFPLVSLFLQKRFAATDWALQAVYAAHHERYYIARAGRKKKSLSEAYFCFWCF